MSRAPQLLTASAEFTITLMNGPEKGAAFKIVSGRVSLGRGPENDIDLSYDSGVSRSHAVISVTPAGIEITDVSDKNHLFVDGQETKKSILKPNSLIQLGQTRLQFKVVQPGGGHLALAKASDGLKAFAGGLKAPRARHSQKSGFSMTHIAIVALVLGGLYYYNSKPKNAGPAKSEIRTEDQLVNDITSIQAEVEAVRANRIRKGKNADNYNEINSHYIRGMRDYSKGQYGRAVESFQACLSLNATHPQCLQYSTLASRAFWQVIDNELLRGAKFKEQNQFAACEAAFQNVKNMVGDPTNKKFMEAEANRAFCEEKSKESF